MPVVRLPVWQRLRQITLNARARFLKNIQTICSSNIFRRSVHWVVHAKITTATYLRKRQFWRSILEVRQRHQFLFSPMVSNQLIFFHRLKQFQGGVTENFEFQIDDDTEVFYSCSATLNGELFVFGGSSTSNNRRKQVLILRFTPKFYYGFRFQK